MFRRRVADARPSVGVGGQRAGMGEPIGHSTSSPESVRQIAVVRPELASSFWQPGHGGWVIAIQPPRRRTGSANSSALDSAWIEMQNPGEDGSS